MSATELRQILHADGWFCFDQHESVVSEPDAGYKTEYYSKEANIIILSITDDGDGLLFKMVPRLGDVFPVMKKGSMIS